MFIITPTGLTGQLKISISSIPTGSIIKYCVDTFARDNEWVTGPTVEGSKKDYYLNDLMDDMWYLVMITNCNTLKRGRPYSSGLHYGITLMREEIESYVYGRSTGYRLKVTTKNPVNMPSKIFLYQRERFSAIEDTERDVFVAVAKPGDLSEYPEDDPVDDIWFFRKDTIDLVEASIDSIEEDWQAIRNDVLELLRALEKIRTLSIPEVYSAGASSVN